MRPRVLALIVGILMAAAPSHAAICEIVCAAAASSNERAPEHSCHRTEAPDDGAPQLSPGAHRCGHGNALPEFSRSVDAPLVIAGSVGAVVLLPLAAPPAARGDRPALPPDPRTLTTQLRI